MQSADKNSFEPNEKRPQNNRSWELEQSLGEPISDILDLETWRPPKDEIGQRYLNLQQELESAIKQQGRAIREIQRRIIPAIRNRQNAPACAGLYQAEPEHLKLTHKNLLFNGATLAVDGTVVSHDTLLLTVVQIGVCRVSYIGQTGEFRRELYRRDVRLQYDDPAEEILALLDQRKKRNGVGYTDDTDEISRLIQRGLMAYGERAALLDGGKNKWLMGHGNPIARELLTGSLESMLTASCELLAKLVLEHKKFIFVTSAPSDRAFLTIGDALLPGQFVIIDTMENALTEWFKGRDFSPAAARQVADFTAEVAPKIVRGVYRASQFAPPYVFYAHIDYAQEAGLIALADSIVQEHRGFPMLLDIADSLCYTTFEPQSFRSVVQQTYAKAGHPYRYLNERETRR